MVQPVKTEKVKELKDLLQGAMSIILNDFTGLKVADISELRRVCRQNGIVYRVVKNNLARRSFRELGLEEVEPLLQGPIAIAVHMEDEAVTARILKDFADDYELPTSRGGMWPAGF